MATIHTWRKAYGALKDHTKVGLAHVNSDFKDVDVAIVKATNHVECPPKERHLRKILAATSVIRPRAHVAYCLHALARRLEKTHTWTVALKTLIVIHKTLREGNPTFRDELLNLQQKGNILQLSNFKDDSSPIAWDCSAWVRTYGVFLEERLQCFRTLKYDIEAERLARPQPGQESFSRTKELDGEELLEQLPALQQLLYRLIECRPEGAAASNYVIQYALALVLKESFKLYCAINDGIINLIDKFFEMPRHEAIKALDIYKRASQQAGSLSDFYEVCKELELARNFQFPVLKEPPQSFLVTMEDYVREAPKTVSLPMVTLEYPERLQLTYKPEEVLSPSEYANLAGDEPNPPPSDDYAVSNVEALSLSSNNVDTGDLWGLNITPVGASTTEDSNDLGLAMVSSDLDTAPSFDPGAIQTKDLDPTGWELALITTSSDISSSNGRQLAGGMDSVTRDSSYDEAAYRTSQQPVNGVPAPNPFEEPDSFSVSSNIAHPSAVQMVDMAQQQANNPFAPYQHAYPQPQEQQHLMMGPQNPFGESEFDTFPANPVAHHQTNNPFGSTGLD